MYENSSLFQNQLDRSRPIKTKYSEPSCVLDLSSYGQILYVLFSPFEWSQDVILIAFPTKIIIGRCSFENDFELKVLAEFEQANRCNLLALSPETSLNVLPNILLFCAVGSDFKLRIIHSNIEEGNKCKVLAGHSSYINDVAFDPENNFLASVSDDHTAKLWETNEFTFVDTLQLTSPGMSTCWHKEDSSKLLVAEKIGLIRFYNVNNQMPILSLDYGKSLSAAHWAPSNSQMIGSLQLGELLIWDLTRPSIPTHMKLLYSEAGGSLKFSPFGELIATINRLESSLNVTHVHGTLTQKMTAHISIPSNLSWHYRLPVLCVGDDTKLCFWRIFSN